MSTQPSHRSVAAIRPTNTPTPTPASPHTPVRTLTSTFASPSTLRAEEDTIVIELGARFLRVGLAGDALPKAKLEFGPERRRRAGDFRQETTRRPATEGRLGEDWELWAMDLRGRGLGVVGDRIESALREAFTKHLLIDARPRKMVLALPALMPLPLLATVLDTLFASFQPPSIAMYPIPVLETVAAGVRAALVVDIGWAETVISSVYELREVKSWRSVRACKMMVQEMASLLGPMVSFEECQQQLTRMAWCRPRRQEDLVLIPTQTSTRQIPFDDLAKPCEETLLASGEPAAAFDDQELPIHHLIYRALQQLPISVRSSCMSRIIFTGGGANIPGVKTRLLEEVRAMLSAHGWDPVRGDAVQALKNKNHPQSDTSTAHSPSAAALATHPPDPIEAKLRAESTAKTRSAPEHGELSAIETLGAWSGASLLAQLKVASVSVVEREQWLAHGLGGASRSADVGLAPGTRLSMGPAVLKATERERTSWNLGVWA